MTNYAQFVAKKAPLASEFGEKFARRSFGDDDIDAFAGLCRAAPNRRGQSRRGWARF
jgi:hypothetical protein